LSITIVCTFIVQTSFTIVTYDHQNMFIIQATDERKKEFFVDEWKLANGKIERTREMMMTEAREWQIESG
jgi:hypothetical protein